MCHHRSDDDVRRLFEHRVVWKDSARVSKPKDQFRRVIVATETISLPEMDAVAMAPEGSAMDDFKREPSPMNDKDSYPIKKQNIRKRTKTGCLSECDPHLPLATTRSLLLEHAVDTD